MAVLGIDDTDSATKGMCTTYIGALVAERLAPAGTTTYLVRLSPAIEHKTRGNGAVGIYTTAPLETALDVARDVITTHARVSDPNTNPGLVGVPDAAVTADVARYSVAAIRRRCRRDEANTHLDGADVEHDGWGNGRGLIGATAAVGAVGAARGLVDAGAGIFDDWTYEQLSYRAPDRWGTTRDVDAASVRTATEAARPQVWDNVDPATGQLACVPRTPCPVLYGIRGDSATAVTEVASLIDGEPVARRRLFVTNQGTDAHLRPGMIGRLQEGRSYRTVGTVVDGPDNRPGGHVGFSIGNGAQTVRCLAFEPTKRFRQRVRRLQSGDRIIACGEIGQGTLKLEKFALREPVQTELVPPRCPTCGNRMKSAGRGQGYRCRDCSTRGAGKVMEPIERELEPGWYEVPPVARRHLAKPLVRTTQTDTPSTDEPPVV